MKQALKGAICGFSKSIPCIGFVVSKSDRNLGLRSIITRSTAATSAVIDGGTLNARTEQLGPVSSMRYRTSTPGLSTWWSSTAR